MTVLRCDSCLSLSARTCAYGVLRSFALVVCFLLWASVFGGESVAQAAPQSSPESSSQASTTTSSRAPAQGPANAGAQPVTLTLKDAVQLALKQNPEVVSLRLLSLESERDRQIARSALLPQASLKAGADLVQYNTAIVGRSKHRATAGPYQYIEAGPAYSQNIFDLPLIRKYQISREGVREAQAQENVTREDVAAAVVTQYILVLRAEATYDAAKTRVALAQRLYEQAANLQKTGVGLNIDTTRARVELQNERQNLTDAETLTHTTSYILAELLDLPQEQQPVLADKLEFFDLPALEPSTAISQAFANRPEMQAQASEERIVLLQRKSAQDERAPKLDFSGDWFYQGGRFNNGVPAYNYAIEFNVPLFTSGRIHAEIARAGLEQQRIAENRRALESRIVREVKTAIDELDAAHKNVDAANLGLQLANDEVAQAERRFAAGVTTNVEVVTAQDALARANANQIDALYRFNQSRVNLAQAMGEVQNVYAK
jgi:outer membrane protein